MIEYLRSHSQLIWMVDVRILKRRVEAYWVYCEAGMQPVEYLRSLDGIEVAVQIPENLQKITDWQVYCYADEPVEFLRDLSNG